MKKTLWLLAVIILLFLSTHLFKLSEIPPALYWDEASIGYNAYAILSTGHDEWGDFLPIHFRAFGEFKLPVYIYSVVFSEKFLGLNILAVRLPAVFFSLGTVILIFLLVYQLSQNKLLALLSSLFLTISPWFFIISRTGFEATAGLMFFLLGLYLSLFIKRSSFFIFFSLLSFIASIYSYNSFRIIAPITIIALSAFWLKEQIYKNKKNILIWFISVLFSVISLIPIWRLIYFDSGAIRLQTIGVISGSENKYLLIIGNYFSHFSLDYLFINGDINLRSSLGNFGELYWFQLPLLLLAFLYLYQKRDKLSLLTIFVILISPIPAAITKEAPHALRTITAIPFLSVMSAMGAIIFFEKIKFKELFILILLIVSLSSFGNYFYLFLTNYPIKSATQWQYGYKEIFTKYQSQFSLYDHVLISDFYAQPYIFGLFYLKYSPNEFLASVQYNPPDKWGFSKVASFGNFIFQPIRHQNIPDGKSLIFATPSEKLNHFKEKNKIYNLDNNIAFYVYEYSQ